MDEQLEKQLVYLASKRLTVRTNLKVQALEAMMAKSNPELFTEYVKMTIQLERDSEAMQKANQDIQDWAIKNLGRELSLD